MRRISMVGSAGAGKSTTGRELAHILGVPFVELDSIYHQPDWVPLPAEEFRRRVAEVAAGKAWVVDGNYSAARPLVWARADTVVWLDLPRRTVMRQVVWRTLRRATFRIELWNGNRERYAAAAVDPAYAHLRFVRLRNRREVRRFLAAARPPGGAADRGTRRT